MIFCTKHLLISQTVQGEVNISFGEERLASSDMATDRVPVFTLKSELVDRGQDNYTAIERSLFCIASGWGLSVNSQSGNEQRGER
jgi:hypothetical protein